MDVDEAMDVSTINRLLQDVVQAERTLHRELFDTVVKKEQISQRLTSHQKSVAVLGSVQSESKRLHSDILEMSALANVVSDQVRQLDTERNSVQATITKVVLNVDIAACMDGIKNSLENEEYEAAAGFVEALLHLQESVTDSGLAQEKQQAQFNHTREAVASVIRDKINSAAVKDDAAQVLSYGKLFPKLGLSHEGLSKICQFLCKRIAEQSNQDRLSTSNDSSDGGGNCTALLSELFRSIVSCIEEHGADLVNTFGSNALETLIRSLNKECDICGSHLLKRYMDYRNIFQTAKDVSAYNRNSTSSEESAVDPRVIEEYLEEIVAMCQISREYNRFLTEKMTSGQHGDPHMLSDNGNAFNGDHYNRSLHEVVGFYIRLEEFYMYENVALAIRINEQGDSLTGSMVDDIFYILQKCARRASETGSIQAVCASLNHVNNILSSEVHSAIGEDLQRAGSNLLDDIISEPGAELETRQPKAATAINNADVIADNVLVLKQDIEVNLDGMFSAATERERIKSCLHEIRDICSMFRQFSHDAIKDMVQGVLAHIRPIFDTISGLSYELDEDQYSEHEACDPWVQHLLVELEEKVFQNLRPHFVSSSFNVFIGLFAEALAARMEGIILSELRFSQLGGLQLEREIRRLTLHLSSAFPHASVRESFARLTQMATILNMETPGEVVDFWGDLSGSKLTEVEIKKALKLRSDFKVEIINSLPAFQSR